MSKRAGQNMARRNERGFTMLQLLLTVVIIVIVSTFAVMGITRARATMRLSGSERELGRTDSLIVVKDRLKGGRCGVRLSAGGNF